MLHMHVRHIAEAGGAFERDLLRAEMEAPSCSKMTIIMQIVKDALHAWRCYYTTFRNSTYIFRLYAAVAVFTYMIMSISQGWLEAYWLNVHHNYVQVMMSPPLLTCLPTVDVVYQYF